MKARQPPPRRSLHSRRLTAQNAKYGDWIRSQVAPDLTELLCRMRPSLAKEQLRTRAALSYIVWISGRNTRRHSHCRDAFFIGFKELRALFGRNFQELNARHRVVEIVRDWLPDGTETDWLPMQQTRAYRLVPDMQAAYDAYREEFCSQIERDVSTVRPLREISATGRVHRTPREAIAHENAHGWRRRVWKDVELRRVVPVDLHALSALRSALGRFQREGWQHNGALVPLTETEREYVHALRVEASDMLLAACSDAGGIGGLPQRYAESKEGRLYSMHPGGTPSLQNCSRVIRYAALCGRYDLDISNCHLAIIHQLAAAAGLTCARIARYLVHKRELRQQLAWRHCLTVEQVKQALIAVVYGACPWVFYGRPAEVGADFTPALVELMGERRARTLQSDADFRGIADDVRKARAAILRDWPCGRQRLYGLFGGSVRLRALNETFNRREGRMRRKDTSDAQRLACVVQDVESAMLRAVVRHYGDEVLIVQHDGWSAVAEMNIPAVEALLKRETACDMTPGGFAVSVEQKLIAPLSIHELTEIIRQDQAADSGTYGTPLELSTVLASFVAPVDTSPGSWVTDPLDPYRCARTPPLLMPAVLAA